MDHRDAIPKDELARMLASETSLADAYPDPDELRRARDRFASRRRPLPPPPRRLTTPAFSPLPAGDGPPPARPPRVCIVTPDISGPVRNGGIGTAYTALARALASAGHQVTVLFTLGPRSEQGAFQPWVDRYGAEGIDLQPLLPAPRPAAFVGPAPPHDAYLWLKDRRFDVIHFPDWRGSGYFATRAKRLALAFTDTVLCVGLHAPTVWHALEDGQAIDREEQLGHDALERGSVAAADVVVAPSAHLLRWVGAWEWQLPDAVHVHPNLLPFPPVVADATARPVEEIVFFGRLETRKGLTTFCDAVDLLVARGLAAELRVAFLGKTGTVAGMDGACYARQRARAWRFPVSVEDGLGQPEALAYLAAADRRALAVMPSLADNAPYTVLECLGSGVPFLAASVGGIPEMIAAESRDGCLVAPAAAHLADAIQRARREGVVPARPAVPFAHARERWIRWHEAQVRDGTPRAAAAPPPDRTPLVSVCMATRDRPRWLRGAVESALAQTHERVEIVLLDDGSETPAAAEALAELELKLRERGFPVLRGPRRYPGAARNAAACAARGKYLLFMDDDNLALPREVETLVRAAEHAQAEVLTCGMDAFAGLDAPHGPEGFVHRWMPLGPAMPSGLLANCLGDTNCLVRRDAFFELGGFLEEEGAGMSEDWAFLARAVACGARFEVVPEVLFHYRLGPHGHGQAAPPERSYLRGLAPHLERLPGDLALLLLYAAGLHRRLSAAPPQLRGPDSPGRGASLVRGGTSQLIDASALLERCSRAPHVTVLPLAGVEPLHEVEAVLVPEGLRLRSTGTDPQVRLPRFAVPPGAEPLLRVEIDVPRETWVQLFWKSLLSPFYGERRSLLVMAAAGPNALVFPLPRHGRVGSLRLDPGALPGDYVLRSLEVRTGP